MSKISHLQELGAFLRARREGLDPLLKGLHRLGRRRTPGLRREDVAALADIGVTWYSKLEQGRAPGISSKVLSAVAQALDCSATETRHLFTLAGLEPPSDVLAPQFEQPLGDDNQRLLDQLDPMPAVILNPLLDIMGFNQAFCRLIALDLQQIAPEDRNCIYLSIVNPQWQAAFAKWDDFLLRQAAHFRVNMAEYHGGVIWEQPLNRYLSLSEDFRRAWQSHKVCGVEDMLKPFCHPQLGLISLRQVNWWAAPKMGSRLVVYMPVDAEGQHKLDALALDGA